MRHIGRFRSAVLFAALVLPIFSPPLARASESSDVSAHSSGMTNQFNEGIKQVNAVVEYALFFDIAFGSIRADRFDSSGSPILDEAGQRTTRVIGVPFVVAVLVLGAIFFTFYFGWINIRGFHHSLDVIAGKYDNPEDEGEISHFRALTSALSATIGLGNVAGVAIAIQLGGPGAVFWMLLTAIFGMSAKFSSCALAQLYRQTNSDGSISGGPMYYLDIGLGKRGGIFKPIGKFLGVMFAVMVMGAAVGGGNMFQANQAYEAMFGTFIARPLQDLRGLQGDALTAAESANGKIQVENIARKKTWSYPFGILFAILVALVILGGIKRIGAATSRIVPGMCGLYVLACIYILLTQAARIPEAIGLIFSMAFTKNAIYGGVFGVLVFGVKRAAFSNEAGIGSAAIVHAAAKTDEPVREGLVAMIGPFIDTIIICFMTSMVVITTGAWNDPTIPQEAGVLLTTHAFGTAGSAFPYVLTICIILFAYSTMISWCYYGERGWIYLLDHCNGAGLRTVGVFRVMFVIAVFVGAVTHLKPVLNFSDNMILCMAFPNIVGSLLLAGSLKPRLEDYWKRYQAKQFKVYG